MSNLYFVDKAPQYDHAHHSFEFYGDDGDKRIVFRVPIEDVVRHFNITGEGDARLRAIYAAVEGNLDSLREIAREHYAGLDPADIEALRGEKTILLRL